MTSGYAARMSRNSSPVNRHGVNHSSFDGVQAPAATSGEACTPANEGAFGQSTSEGWFEFFIIGLSADAVCRLGNDAGTQVIGRVEPRSERRTPVRRDEP